MIYQRFTPSDCKDGLENIKFEAKTPFLYELKNLTPKAHLYLSWSNLYTDLRISKNLKIQSSSSITANFLKCVWISFRRFLGLLLLITFFGRNLWRPTSRSRYSKLDFLSRAMCGISRKNRLISIQQSWIARSRSRDSKFLLR